MLKFIEYALGKETPKNVQKKTKHKLQRVPITELQISKKKKKLTIKLFTAIKKGEPLKICLNKCETKQNPESEL